PPSAVMMLPATAASSRCASCPSHCALGPPAGSPSRSTSMLKPVVKVSGSSTRSVCPASGSSSDSKCARLAAGSCQASGCCTSETRGRFVERRVALGDAQAQKGQPLRLRIEGRKRDGGDARLGQQPFGEGQVVVAREGAVIEQLEIRP